MTDHQMIIDELKQQRDLISKQTDRLSGIEKALSEIAVQGKDINHLHTQVNGLWRKYDEVFNPNGIIAQMKNHQASCPKDDIKTAINRQWVAIGLIFTLIGILKLWE